MTKALAAAIASAPAHDPFLGVTWIISEIGEIGRGIAARAPVLEHARAIGDLNAMQEVTADIFELHRQGGLLLAVLIGAMGKIEQHEHEQADAGDD